MLGALIASCKQPEPKNVDLDLIHVSADARLRTDDVGEPPFVDRATFVLVDASNTSPTGAYVTLGGTLRDGSGAAVGRLKAQSLWVPPGGERTFALVDDARVARPTAAAASIEVRGALIPQTPPPARVDDVKEHDDYGKAVATGVLVNDADRPGNIMVIASFHDAEHHPMTRPFEIVRVDAHARRPVQYVGPQGSVHGTIFVGDVVY